MNPSIPEFTNPFRPGAGHRPPYLAGRKEEEQEFRRLLEQEIILENMILTGLRGVGKTVLLDTFKPIAIQEGWLWVGADVSETVSISEANIVIRIITDLSVATSSFVIPAEAQLGFQLENKRAQQTLNYSVLLNIYKAIPGLPMDKLKGVLEYVWHYMPKDGQRGLIFAYDEAQNFSDNAEKDEYPLSLLLDVSQSIQKKGIPFMLVLTGLPTLFPKLVEARTYTERMFRVVFLERLIDDDSREAILKPIDDENCPITFKEESVETICKVSRGYPYFIQFICREAYDVWIQKARAGEEPSVPVDEIIRKLDSDFFAGRWSRVTDRQRDLLNIIAQLDNCEEEFSVKDIVSLSEELPERPFGSSHVYQMLGSLSNSGLVYKNRYGKYSFAVPLMRQFILRQFEQAV